MSARVAVVTCAGDDVDPDSPLLLGALADAGIEAELAVWDDPLVDWERYELSVIRSTWDYVGKFDAFSRWARETPRVLNEPRAVSFSLDKHYLARLAERGVEVVPTRFVEVGEDPGELEGDLVVKPAVGAGSMGAERFRPGEAASASGHVAALHSEGRSAMIQPYVHSVDSDGECALVYIDGSFSHSMRKGAMLNVSETDRNGLFRMEQMSRHQAAPEARAAADAVLDAAGFDDLLYARVDLVVHEGRHVLMELELVEPSLFFTFAPEAAPRLAVAIARRLG